MSEISDRWAVVDVGGIGYKVHMTADALHGRETGTEISLWTHFAVREDSQDLYGFTNRRERDFFELLITVSGIGPKTAMNILSLVSSEALSGAILSGSTAHLVKISGIGRKTAEKIILELKDKLDALPDESGLGSAGSDADAIEALRALGYSADEARNALRDIDRGIADTGAKIKAALKVLT